VVGWMKSLLKVLFSQKGLVPSNKFVTILLCLWHNASHMLNLSSERQWGCRVFGFV
jgi:hypothetical protein